MQDYIVRRLIASLITLFFVSLLIFFLVYLFPGDVLYVLLGDDPGVISPEIVANLRQRLGLDLPVHIQYLRWFSSAVQGDFGESLVTGRSIGSSILMHFPKSLELVFVAVFLGVVIGIPLGVISSATKKPLLDIGVSLFVTIGISFPVFVTGTLLVLLFAVILRWVPAAGHVSFWVNPRTHLIQLLLPAITLSFSTIAIVTRMTRSSMQEVLREEYINAARSKGLSERVIIYKHALKNAVIPVVTVIGIQCGTLLGGTVIVERIFVWPGMGTYLMMSVDRRDFLAIQAAVLTISVFFIFFNFITDILYGFLDPRIKYE